MGSYEGNLRVFDGDTVICTLSQTFQYQWKDTISFEEFVARENIQSILRRI